MLTTPLVTPSYLAIETSSSSKYKSSIEKGIVVTVVLLCWGYSPARAQNHMLAFVKKAKLVSTYTTGDLFTFMDSSKHWQYGIVAKVWKDSFALRPYVLEPGHLDTSKFDIASYSLKDVYAMPKAGIQIEEIRGPKNHRINGEGGHVHFYWIKGGWLFRALGLGYAGLNVFNALVIGNQSISWQGLGYAAGLFLVGEVLKYSYKPYWKLNGKYKVKVF